MLKEELQTLTTERRNSKSFSIDEMTVEEQLWLMNSEDAQVASVVKKAIPEISKVIKKLFKLLNLMEG